MYIFRNFEINVFVAEVRVEGINAGSRFLDVQNGTTRLWEFKLSSKYFKMTDNYENEQFNFL